MATRGRPGLTPERYQERLYAYCSRYGVKPLETGLPPFPSGRRETAQHRAWLALYKAHRRLSGRLSRASEDARREQLAHQQGRCPVCDSSVDVSDVLDVEGATGRTRGLLHAACAKRAREAEAAGPEALERMRSYLWPVRAKRGKRP